MEYKFRYEADADVLLLILKGKGKLSHAEEFGDVVAHFDKKGKPLFLELLNASKIIPLMVQAMAKKETVASLA